MFLDFGQEGGGGRGAVGHLFLIFVRLFFQIFTLTFLNKLRILLRGLNKAFGRKSANISDCRAFRLFKTVPVSLPTNFQVSKT